MDYEYSNIQPVAPEKNAVVVFSVKCAELAFKYGMVDFVIVLNEKNNKYVYCYSIRDVEEFLDKL